MLSDEELFTLLSGGTDTLKDTTQGYKGHPASWYTNVTTNWFKGLAQIRQVSDAIKARHTINVTLSVPVGTVLVPGVKLLANVKAS